MDFRQYMLEESSLRDLYSSAVRAFPHTSKRQHATDPIVIASLRYTPWLGVKTLFVKGLAQNEGSEYSPMILFKGVNYRQSKDDSNVIALRAEGKTYFLEQMSARDTDTLVRCNCQDFYWRFHHFDKLDRSLYGSNRKKYEAKHNPGSANPLKLPGMCKHVMKMMKALDEAKIIR